MAQEREEIVETLAIPSGDVDSDITTAKAYPRSVTRFREEALTLATLDQATAQACIYALPRAGKQIKGPSVRFSEILLYSWGNAAVDCGVTEEGATHIEAASAFKDIEKNVLVRVRVKRRITNKDGARYDADMIGVTGNAATSVARRNSILAGIPKPFWEPIYERARQVAIGQAGTLSQNREKWLDWYAKAGIQPDRVCALLEVDGPEDIGMDELETLVGLSNAIHEGSVSVEDLLSEPDDDDKPVSLAEKLKAAKAAKNGDPATVEKVKARKAERDSLVSAGLAYLDQQLEAKAITDEDHKRGVAWLKNSLTAIQKLRAKILEWGTKASQGPGDTEGEPDQEPGEGDSAPEDAQDAIQEPGHDEYAGDDTESGGESGESDAERMAREFDEAEGHDVDPPEPPTITPQKAGKLRQFASDLGVALPDLTAHLIAEYGVDDALLLNEDQYKATRLWLQQERPVKA